MNDRFIRPVAWLLLIGVLGCAKGDTGPALYPVTGTVKKDGKPLAGVSVSLVATNQKVGIALMGVTKDDGTFEIATGQGKKGAPEGTFKVVLSKGAGAVPADPKDAYAGARKDPRQSAGDEIPKEWQSASTTTKTFDVKKGADNTLNIEL
jgi:hypothetical protein